MTEPYDYTDLTKQLRGLPIQLGLNAADAIDSLRTQLATAKRERDALIADHEAATEQISDLHAICDGYYWREAERSAQMDNLQADISRLVAFKEYVHNRLDAAGIERKLDGVHSKAGCRIGDRLDLALAYVPPVAPPVDYVAPSPHQWPGDRLPPPNSPAGHVLAARNLVAPYLRDPATRAMGVAILSLCDALDAR